MLAVRRHLVTLGLILALILIAALLLAPLVWTLRNDRSAWPTCDLDPTPPCLK